METNFENLLDKVSAHVKDMVSTETVLGDEFQLGEYSCRPVIRVGVGFGSGGGHGDDNPKKCHGNGGGAGAGIGIMPVGFLAAKKDEITFIPTSGKKGLDTLFEKLPEMMDKFAEMKSKKESSDKK